MEAAADANKRRKFDGFEDYGSHKIRGFLASIKLITITREAL